MGKSWLAFGLCIAVATGGYALGKMPVEQGDALYLSLEDPRGGYTSASVGWQTTTRTCPGCTSQRSGNRLIGVASSSWMGG